MPMFPQDLTSSWRKWAGIVEPSMNLWRLLWLLRSRVEVQNRDSLHVLFKLLHCSCSVWKVDGQRQQKMPKTSVRKTSTNFYYSLKSAHRRDGLHCFAPWPGLQWPSEHPPGELAARSQAPGGAQPQWKSAGHAQQAPCWNCGDGGEVHLRGVTPNMRTIVPHLTVVCAC